MRKENIAIGSEDSFLTELQLAARHQRSIKTLRNLRVSGGYIPYVKLGRHVRYRLSDVQAYEAAHLHGGNITINPGTAGR